jgi:adenine-specific DNA-methyltransferase
MTSVVEKRSELSKKVEIKNNRSKKIDEKIDYLLWLGDVENFLDRLPKSPLFDLVITSPPYNIGKPYEKPMELNEYCTWQERVISKIIKRMKPSGSICWQVGNHISNGNGSRGRIFPLDYLFHPIFESHKLILRNRIIWKFGHGLHCKYRFSGRYEVILWYTLNDDYIFNLDDIRIDSKYPGKRYYKGPNVGNYSGNPDGKNPEDVWEKNSEVLEEDVWGIPNVKSNHIEKTIHPCQFPVGLIERLVKALTNENGLVFDPYAGVFSSGVASALYHRRFWGCDIMEEYVKIGKQRIIDALEGNAKYRPYYKPIYDHTKSKLSKKPEEWKKK